LWAVIYLLTVTLICGTIVTLNRYPPLNSENPREKQQNVLLFPGIYDAVISKKVFL
jgi:predicted esterase